MRAVGQATCTFDIRLESPARSGDDQYAGNLRADGSNVAKNHRDLVDICPIGDPDFVRSSRAGCPPQRTRPALVTVGLHYGFRVISATAQDEQPEAGLS